MFLANITSKPNSPLICLKRNFFQSIIFNPIIFKFKKIQLSLHGKEKGQISLFNNALAYTFIFLAVLYPVRKNFFKKLNIFIYIHIRHLQVQLFEKFIWNTAKLCLSFVKSRMNNILYTIHIYYVIVFFNH